jgi:ring-1,2-phenylacetyl-CoA epoxidase subunit PaaD
VLATVLDPEVPVVSVVDLGIVRAVIDDADALTVVVTPTYSGCPATEVIEASIVAALDDAGLGPTRIRMQRAPAWTSDWISESGRPSCAATASCRPARRPRERRAPSLRSACGAPLACPRCESKDTERLAAFGATACKALWRCRACGEPFEHFKRSRRAIVALHFHPLRVKSVRPETDEAVVVSFDVPAELAEQFRFTQGPAPDAEGNVAGSEQRRSYSICAGPSTASCASASARCRAACSRPGSTSRSRSATRCR